MYTPSPEESEKPELAKPAGEGSPWEDFERQKKEAAAKAASAAEREAAERAEDRRAEFGRDHEILFRKKPLL